MRHEWIDAKTQVTLGADEERIVPLDGANNVHHYYGICAREILRLAARVQELEELVVPALEGQVARRIDRIAALEEENRRLRAKWEDNPDAFGR